MNRPSPTLAPMPVQPVPADQLPGVNVAGAVIMCGWLLVVDADGCSSLQPAPGTPLADRICDQLVDRLGERTAA